MQLLVIFVPVLLGMIGFGLDLGRFYMSRSELKTAANAMALAAAGRLIGTDASSESATTFSRLAIENNSGFANRYDFGGNAIGESTGNLASEAPDPNYYETLEAAIGDGGEGGSTAGGSLAKYVRINLMGETPVVFWGFLPLAQDRRVAIRATAVAGVSAPLCTACGIEPIAVGAVDASDATHFGFVQGTRYTFGYTCTGQGTPAVLPGGGQRIPYVVLNRNNTETQIFTAEATQLLRSGAQGLPSTPNRAFGCFSVNATEQIWETAQPIGCNQNRVPDVVQAFMCGLSLRFDAVAPAVCQQIPEVETVASAYTPDTDTSDVADYVQYTGTGKRIITIPIVDSTTNLSAMTILGFRQFFLEPEQNAANINAADTNGRFIALYLGAVAPVHQGSIGGCQQPAGPGKVVLHR